MHHQQNKVTPDHLKRNAYLYIRQSSLKQVVENQESTKRQYNLKSKVAVLGWPENQIIVIDCDQGQSGSETLHRKGFQKLVAEVGMGKAGIVIGLEVSRLARNSMDWHRLLEICALTNTLILDEDGLYDPGHFNDRLLLGLKGTMSEAELHFLKARLRGGALNKAARGELKLGLPVGFLYDSENNVMLDPNTKVQQSIKEFFKIFERKGTAYLAVREFRKKGLKFPRRPGSGPFKGQLIWVDFTHHMALRLLHNPRYAGAFTYGRTRQTKLIDGSYSIRKNPKDHWHSFLPDSHDGYITLEQFNSNQNRLLENAQAHGHDRRKSPPREGPALLQGIVVCGICGRRMTLRYYETNGNLYPDYVCQNKGIEQANKICQRMAGRGIDIAVGKLVVDMVTPISLEIAMTVQKELESQVAETIKLRKKHLEQIQYEVDLSKRRYMAVDPNNRLVADSLETDWNQKLKTYSEAKEEFDQKCKNDQLILKSDQKKEIMSLAADFPKLWADPGTPDREKKRMIRLLVEDVTLTRGENILVQIRFKGGSHETLKLPLPLNYFLSRKMPSKIVKEVDNLLDTYTNTEIANILNGRGERTGEGFPFKASTIVKIKYYYKLKDRKTRLLEKGMITRTKMKILLGIGEITLRKWKNKNLVKTHAFGGGETQVLYEPPNKTMLIKLNKLKENIPNLGT